MILGRPSLLFDRHAEWSDLAEFVSSPAGGLRLGLLYGRRRQGKSFILRRLCEAADGLYYMALQQERTPALQRFADAVAEHSGLGAGTLRFDGWEEALRGLVGLRGSRYPRPARLIVIDEMPYLLEHSQELPSAIQALYDESKATPGAPPVRLIICGSALSVMHDLLSGGKALRGRAQLDICLGPFDYRETARFWGTDDPEIALRVHAVLGGTPGYRDLIDAPPPERVQDLGRWLATHVLNPSHALFTEADYLLREDPRITDRALYHSVLGAVSAGAGTPAKIAGQVGRPDRSLAHPLGVLRTAGFVRRIDDVLLQRRPRFVVSDPIVRFHQLVVLPRLQAFEERRALEAWHAAEQTWNAQILGPHFEELARVWVATHAAHEALGEETGPVGPTVVNDPSGRTQYEVDVVALAPGQTPRARNAQLMLIGEAKSSDRPRTLSDLRRLERVRGLLAARGHHAARARLALFARAGFDADLAEEARRRDDLLVVDLPRMYGTSLCS